jgi:molecular chaperone DnaK
MRMPAYTLAGMGDSPEPPLNLPHQGKKLSFSDPPSPVLQAGPPIAITPARTPEERAWSPPSIPDTRSPVAAGIAVEARRAPLLIDVTPLSLNVETVGGYCDILIGANTAIPCDRTRIFLTAADAQTTVRVRVSQGESRRFTENTYLGECELTGLKAAPRGETKIAVTFEIDADGILNVRAKDPSTGLTAQARLKLLGATTEAGDVAEMMKRQERHAVS